MRTRLEMIVAATERFSFNASSTAIAHLFFARPPLVDEHLIKLTDPSLPLTDAG